MARISVTGSFRGTAPFPREITAKAPARPDTGPAACANIWKFRAKPGMIGSGGTILSMPSGLHLRPRGGAGAAAAMAGRQETG